MRPDFALGFKNTSELLPVLAKWPPPISGAEICARFARSLYRRSGRPLVARSAPGFAAHFHVFAPYGALLDEFPPHRAQLLMPPCKILTSQDTRCHHPTHHGSKPPILGQVTFLKLTWNSSWDHLFCNHFQTCSYNFKIKIKSDPNSDSILIPPTTLNHGLGFAGSDFLKSK